ncbi:hypothetical protein H6H03_35430 [Nostoc paludosum FACHB-159]|uniref:Uncharacterized protein n=1 Tax=Nostoc paludosum FACHB-159 TaxID=2692908 RepID=A0ABR8KHR8_9NOSO|nr:hypothetical protein [Nostoc sp. FACHB-857]MBD2739101.1 hypothetical protein [Nostoc paludosum FACHB-159]
MGRWGGRERRSRGAGGQGRWEEKTLNSSLLTPHSSLPDAQIIKDAADRPLYHS